MTGEQDFTPEWTDDQDIKPGLYIWPVYVKACAIKDRAKDKPYALLHVIVEDFEKKECPQHNFEFDFRVYLHNKSKGWCIYFLSKFDYPEELFKGKPAPIVRASEIEGLHGQLLVQAALTDAQFLQIDVKGFDHIDGKELPDKLKALAKKQTENGGQEESSIDLEHDVKEAAHTRIDPQDPLNFE